MRLKTINSGESTSGGKRLALAFALAAALGGCDTMSALNPFDRPEVYKPEVTPEVPADKLYNEGLARLQNGDTEGANKKFEEIDKQAPFSPYSKRGLIMTAYANYEAAKYDDAINASKRFLAQNPASPDAAYAQYILAMSYYNQIPDATRDQERTDQALRAMQELLDRYPKSEYVLDVREKMLVARDQLAGKEMNVGRFYLEKRNYTGAVGRFRDVITKYQTTRHVEEALMRLTMPDGTAVPPSLFIPVAERTGMILELGRWAIRTACRELMSNEHIHTISVNVSPVQLKAPGFAASVAAALGEAGVTGDRLALEITEGLEMEMHSDVLRCISDLKLLGIKVWLDDFGTGFAGLSWLRLIDFDTVKIDRSFLHDCVTPRGRAMFRDIVGLLRNRGPKILVEGVESEEQLELLRKLDIDHAQGYHIGRPAPAERIRALFEEPKRQRMA